MLAPLWNAKVFGSTKQIDSCMIRHNPNKGPPAIKHGGERWVAVRANGMRHDMRKVVTVRLARALLVSLLALIIIAIEARAQDTLTVGSASALSGGVAQVPVYLRDVSTTTLGSDAAAGNRIQGIAFKVTYAPSPAVASISFSRAGVLQSLTPLYETTIPSTNAIAYVGSFSETANAIPLVLNAAAPGDRIGTLLVTFTPQATAGTVATLSIDSTTATLSNQAGTVGETVANANLALAAGTATVDGATTTTSLASSANPSVVSQNVTFTATVASGTAGTITGTVTFKDSATTLGTAAVSGGQAMYSTAALAQGTHSITAVYSGDATYLTSASSALSQVVNANVFGAPPGFSATATSTSQVSLTWVAVAGANHYEVFRTSSISQPFVSIASPVTASYIDTPVTAGVTYLYEVRAIDGSGTPSAFSAVDAATTIVFTDDPLVAGSTVVKAVHLTELRTAVNAFRAAAALPPFVFTDSNPAGLAIRALHISELRTALNGARSAIGLGAISFTDPTLTAGSTIVKAVHDQEIREAVK